MKKEPTVLEQAVRRMRRSFYVIGFFSFFINMLMLTAPLYMLQIYDRVCWPAAASRRWSH